MEDIKSSLMTYEEYSERSITPGKSYIYEIEKDDRVLYYIGVAHIYNLTDQQIEGMRTKFAEFVQKTSGRDRIVLVEGGIRPVAESEEEAMKSGGEPNLVTFWAAGENIDIFSPEPDRQQEANHLLEQFSKEEVMHYYFARQVNQWNLMKRPVTLDTHMERTLKRHQDLLNWEGFDFSLENMIKIHQQIIGKEFNPEDWQLFQDLSDPRKNIAAANKVCAESSRFRDTHIVSEILRLWGEKKNIFIVYGRTHAIMQEPALRKLLI